MEVLNRCNECGRLKWPEEGRVITEVCFYQAIYNGIGNLVDAVPGCDAKWACFKCLPVRENNAREGVEKDAEGS